MHASLQKVPNLKFCIHSNIKKFIIFTLTIMQIIIQQAGRNEEVEKHHGNVND